MKMEIQLEIENLDSVGDVSVWRPKDGQSRATFVALHGIQSNQTWYSLLGNELAQRRYSLWAYTRPNHILKPGQKAVADAGSWKEWLDQLEHVGEQARIPGQPLFAMGVSWGARPVLASVLRSPALWSGAVVLNPALKTRKDLRFFLRALCARAPLVGKSTFTIPLEPRDYTDDESTIQKWLTEDLLTTQCTPGFFGHTAKLRKYADAKLRRIQKPTLALLGEADRLVRHQQVKGMLVAADNPQLKVVTINGGTHAMLLERTRSVAAEIIRWLCLLESLSSSTNNNSGGDGKQ